MDDSLSDTGMRGHGDRATRGHGDTGTPRPFAPSPLRPIAVFLLLVALLLSGCTAPVRVEWSTETEMNTAGFDLYRGESPDGPFDVKVNDQLIPPAQDPLTGGDYRYVDKTAAPGVTYYYQLREIEKSGGVNTYGPISVRAGGLVGWQVAALGIFGGLVLFVWLRGGKKVKVGPPAGG